MPSRHFYHPTWDGCLQRKDRLLIDTHLDWDPPMPLVSSASDGRASGRTSRSENSQSRWDLDVALSHDAELDAPWVLDESDIGMLPISGATPLTPTTPPDSLTTYMHPSQDQDQNSSGRLPSAYPYPKLSDADVQALLSIAMPQPRVTVLPVASLHGEAKSYNPRELDLGRLAKKQKTEPSTSNDKPRQKDFLSKKQKYSHNIIEKRYRTNLNDKLVELQQTVPSLQHGPEGEQVRRDTQKTQDEAPYMYGKAVIITQAIEYIGYLEGSTQRLSSEVTTLQVQLAIFKKQLAQVGANVLRHAAGFSKAPLPETLETIQNNFAQIQAEKQVKTDMETKRKAQTRHATQGSSTRKLS